MLSRNAHFTRFIITLVRSRQKSLIDRDDALRKLSPLAGYGWYRDAILEDAKLRMEERP